LQGGPGPVLAGRPSRPQAVSVGPQVVPVAVPAGQPAVPAVPAAVRAGTKTARFLALVADLHGPLAGVPLGSVGRISAAVAPQAGLNTGAARAALRRAVLAAQDGER
jgi:hypothetical protein